MTARVFLSLLMALPAAASDLDYDAMAARITAALKVRPGERVLIRFDPGYFQELAARLEERLGKAGVGPMRLLEYNSKGSQPTTPLEPSLQETDIYLWLPLREDVREITAAERHALARWLDQGGARRQVHFHWSAGSVRPDGLAGDHSPAFDAIYQSALDIDYQALSAAQDRAITLLRSGVVRVRTPAGTDLRFRVGDRPFNKQDGDASLERMQAARVRVDREIELPAGVLRVAPLEESAEGRIVIPEARFGEKVARNVKLEIRKGRITRVEATENLDAVEAALTAGGNAARRFREFALGFNQKLQSPPGARSLPYYGYGSGVVRLSLGDNQELGGAVRGNFVRWFFFPDATVEVDGRPLAAGTARR